MPSSTTTTLRHRLPLLVLGSLVGITLLTFSQSQEQMSADQSPLNGTDSASRFPLLEKMDLPEGRHLAEFATHCLNCHSPHLPLSQPRFPQKKWEEIVHKMVTVYGAQVPKEHEPLIAAYLTAVTANR